MEKAGNCNQETGLHLSASFSKSQGKMERKTKFLTKGWRTFLLIGKEHN